jgi:hypothetical protein
MGRGFHSRIRCMRGRSNFMIEMQVRISSNIVLPDRPRMRVTMLDSGRYAML